MYRYVTGRHAPRIVTARPATWETCAVEASAARPQAGEAEVAIRWLDASDSEEAGRIWQLLEQELEIDTVAASWDWTETWLQHYGDLVPHRFAVCEASEAPCAIALVTEGVGRRRGPFRVRSVHLGTAGEPPGESVFVEYNRLLSSSRHRDAFATALMRELRDEAGWHQLALDGFAPGDAAALLRAEPALRRQLEVCPVMELEAAGRGENGVLGLLRSGARRKVRRSLAELGEVTGEWATTPEEGVDILNELIELHQRRWEAAGEQGAFASPRFAGFHRDLVLRLLPRGAAILFRVRAADRTVGCLYHFAERGRALFYQSGLASYEDKRIAPGFVAFALCMQACLEHGLIEYDFLAGDSRYKRDLSNSSRELVWATAERPAWRWRMMDALAHLRDRGGDDDTG
jgi:hypothetical protein